MSPFRNLKFQSREWHFHFWKNWLNLLKDHFSIRAKWSSTISIIRFRKSNHFGNISSLIELIFTHWFHKLIIWKFEPMKKFVRTNVKEVLFLVYSPWDILFLTTKVFLRNMSKRNSRKRKFREIHTLKGQCTVLLFLIWQRKFQWYQLSRFHFCYFLVTLIYKFSRTISREEESKCLFLLFVKSFQTKYKSTM